jgi:hypothetical protein
VGILYDHFAHVGKADKVDMPALDVLTKHLFQLAQTMPDPSARAARERLTAMQQALYTRLTTVQRTLPSPCVRVRWRVRYVLMRCWFVMTAVSGRKGTWPWPGVEELLFLKLVSVIFPTTGASLQMQIIKIIIITVGSLSGFALRRQISSTR